MAPGDSPQRRVAALTLLKAYGDGYLRQQLVQEAQRLRDEGADERKRQIGRGMLHLLADWPQVRDRQRLGIACAEALVMPPGDRRNAAPAADRLLTWHVLAELLGQQTHAGSIPRPELNLVLDAPRRAALAAHCRQIVANGPDDEKGPAAVVLLAGSVGWDGLTDEDLKQMFLSAHPAVWKGVGMQLAMHKRREQLIAWGRQRAEADHLDVLYMLRQEMPAKWSDQELDLWLTVARRDPLRVAGLLYPVPNLSAELREPIREHLEREAQQPKLTGYSAQIYDLVAAIRLLDHWNRPEDTPLFQMYLKHPGTVQSHRAWPDGRLEEVATYRVREFAKIILERRGVAVPADVVYKEVKGVKRIDGR